ncbi:MAG TPA: septation protein A, partial [Alphaproteobacteria bacterium]|nr:septation protein A [Alphaproteobacteria bacterium]
MKTFLELFPLAIFFIIYKLFDIYYATGALMLATLAQVIILYSIYK